MMCSYFSLLDLRMYESYVLAIGNKLMLCWNNFSAEFCCICKNVVSLWNEKYVCRI